MRTEVLFQRRSKEFFSCDTPHCTISFDVIIKTTEGRNYSFCLLILCSLCKKFLCVVMKYFDAFVGLCTEFVPFHGILHICYFSIMIQTGFLVHKSCKEYVSVNVLNNVINVAKYKAENSSLAPYILCVLFSVSNEFTKGTPRARSTALPKH